ncbi:hypothetical protein WISP_00967 [Willisornis vidua]|uniref:MHC class I-like antigen recognition-like domain-containing protein n=1 Tax=Willisornis vidua TaxID=1566151 RepID=A0ABQ9DW18_9PASS|nr:hypothetical protein WISP_00967 [Willisornis vidua]
MEKDLELLVLQRRQCPCLQEGNRSPSGSLSLLSAPPDPFVAQCVAGCKLYPNRTSLSFVSVCYNGQDFLRFDTENATWTLSQNTNLAWYVQAVLQNYTAFSELVEIIFNETCVDDMEELLHSAGRTSVERQGETSPTLQQPPQSPGAKP